MKKVIFIVAILSSIGFAFTSCKETKKEVIVKEVQVEKEESKGILERAAEKVDKEVNEEIDEEIDRIGDDN
ncbi:hypothetical protein ACE939_10715 [Aquimarina sp. W85]|uniref:hypothetical protein n=1 Tax=Aquimarina rhodophyticola TaxID=3342246 RepID=UPI0036704752